MPIILTPYSNGLYAVPTSSDFSQLLEEQRPTITMSLSISNTALYKLTNSYTGPNFPLALNNSSSTSFGLHVSSTDPFLPWQFLTAPDSTKYNICTKQTGQLLCLDIVSDAKTVPHLATPGYFTGQQWTLTPVGGQGAYKLSNDYSGTGIYLDVYSDTKVAFMDSVDASGESWTLTAISASTSTSTSATTTQNTSNPPLSVTPSATPTPSPLSSSSSSSLSPGAIAGIATGSVTAVFAALGFLLKLYKWKHPKKETTTVR